ncbi:MAG TPA: DUF5615 family PIN-like protein [Verrucomicrobiae bacterium]|jgi:predicted nuclease of predicted toxin-antitoxin system
MRILIDECLPARLRHEIAGHDVKTVKQAGWLGIKNGALLKLAADSGNFDVFLTIDQNLPRQQRVQNLPFAIFVLRAKSNRMEDIRPLIPELIQRLPEARPGQVVEIGNMA